MESDIHEGLEAEMDEGMVNAGNLVNGEEWTLLFR